MTMGMSMPGSSKYERLPTRLRLKLFWAAIFMVGFAYESHKMLVTRVFNRRTEQGYLLVQDHTGGEIPEDALEAMHRKREMRESHSLTNVLNSPMPNELSHALQKEFDPRRIASLRSDNSF